MKVLLSLIHTPSISQAGNATPSDEQLIKQAQTRPEQFAPLYDRYVSNVYRYLLAKVRNPEDAEDLTSQTFLVALENLHRYRGAGNFQAWLFRIAHNKSIDHYRSHKRDVSLAEEDDFVDESLVTPETAVSQAIDVAEIMRQLGNISPDRAEVISLRIFGELEVREIALILKKPETAVRMLLHRGIHDLQNRVAPHSQEKSK